MKAFRNILLVVISLVAWAAGCHHYLSGMKYWQETETAAKCKNTEEFRKAVMESSRNIEPGFQTRTTGNIMQVATKRLAGNSGRVPVLAAQFAKSPQGKVPVIIRTYKSILFAAFHSRDFYVIGLRHLII